MYVGDMDKADDCCWKKTAWDLRCYVREKMIEFIQQNYPQSLPQVRATLTDADKT